METNAINTNQPMLELWVEAAKMLDIYINEPSAFRVKANNSDLAAMPFKQNSLGFFVAFVRKVNGGLPAIDSSAKDFLKSFKLTDCGKFVQLSVCCTWDRVPVLFRRACKFDVDLVGFSTPQHLQLLLEEPKNIGFYKE